MNRTTIAVAIIFIPLLVLVTRQQDRAAPYIATDGDTIRHGGERIRLLYIDAPEMPGHTAHCTPNCVAGDPYASKESLQEALDSGQVRCEGEERDRYGRRLAECFVTAPGGQSVSINEWMISVHQAMPYHYRGASR